MVQFPVLRSVRIDSQVQPSGERPPRPTKEPPVKTPSRSRSGRAARARRPTRRRPARRRCRRHRRRVPRPGRRRVDQRQLRHDRRHADLPRVRLDLRHDRERVADPADHFYRDVKFRLHARRRRAARRRGGWVGGTLRPPVERHPRPGACAPPRSAGSSSCSPHDLWGADGYPISRFPGDNGNWTDYDNFLTRLINDVRAAGLTVQWDIWNEPNITIFWNRPAVAVLRTVAAHLPARSGPSSPTS